MFVFVRCLTEPGLIFNTDGKTNVVEEKQRPAANEWNTLQQRSVRRVKERGDLKSTTAVRKKSKKSEERREQDQLDD